jgi:nitroimidazol reductase NimA-like FMN-containing flavoprotein (pyridoxamine 5'-phosphate oxidase superfamily)
MEELDDTECRKPLAERHLGRLAIPDVGGPVSFSVNSVLGRDAPVFRIDPRTKLDAATERESVAFEVDAAWWGGPPGPAGGCGGPADTCWWPGSC